MKAKSSAHYQREFRRRLREQGLVKKEVWILPENANLLSHYEKVLRTGSITNENTGETSMNGNTINWSTNTLYDALKSTSLFTSGQADIELIDGIEPALHILMFEYGDLPIFLTVSGEQIIVESSLWSRKDVIDPQAFNEAILRSHKFFPLSTINLDKVGSDGDFYHMFGALSSSSLLQNVVFEIEVLANNVIQATEAYSNFLKLETATN